MSFRTAPNCTERTRVLLAEDDPVSALFMTETLQRIGLHVDSCEDGWRALEHAHRHRFDLLLLDCQLPGLGARQILAALRASADSASRDAPAIASSADITHKLEADLYEDGFHRVLRKPLRTHDVEWALQPWLPNRHPLQLLDDTAALNASGNPETLQTLRNLFASELHAMLDQLDVLQSNPQALHERLHRLRASCGFCGAQALSSECVRLAAAAPAVPSEALAAFRTRLEATLQALRQHNTAAT